MKKLKMLLSLILVAHLSAQTLDKPVGDIGINTDEPAATLDIKGHPTNLEKFDGVIAPRITGEQMRAKEYTMDQNGAIDYATAADPQPAGQTIHVTAPGYYYFDGPNNLWVGMKKQITENSRYVKTKDELLIGSNDGTIVVDIPGFRNDSKVIPLPSAINKQNEFITICNVNDRSNFTVRVDGVSPLQTGSSIVNVPVRNCKTFKSVASANDTGSFKWIVISGFNL